MDELVTLINDIEMKNIFMFVRVDNELIFFEHFEHKLSTHERAAFLTFFRNVYTSQVILRNQEVRKLGFKLKIGKVLLFFEGQIRYSDLGGTYNHEIRILKKKILANVNLLFPNNSI